MLSMIISAMFLLSAVVVISGDYEPNQLLNHVMSRILRHVTSSAASASRQERTVDEHLLSDQLAQTMVTFTPKLEITSPNFPPDGGAVQLYTTIPISLKVIKSTFLMSKLRANNDDQMVQNNDDIDYDSEIFGSWYPDNLQKKPDHFPHPNRYHQHHEAKARYSSRHSSAAGVHDYLELLLERLGMPGSACLSRIVCHLSADRLRNNGLLGDVINILAEEPSSKNRKLQEEIKVARSIGLAGASCRQMFNQCHNMLFDRIIPHNFS